MNDYELDNRDIETTWIHTHENIIEVYPLELMENALENNRAPFIVRILFAILKYLWRKAP